MDEDSSEELTVLTVKKGTDIWNDDTPEANDWKHPYVQHREYEQGSVVAVSDLTLDIDSSGIKLFHKVIPRYTIKHTITTYPIIYAIIFPILN